MFLVGCGKSKEGRVLNERRWATLVSKTHCKVQAVIWDVTHILLDSDTLIHWCFWSDHPWLISPFPRCFKNYCMNQGGSYLFRMSPPLAEQCFLMRLKGYCLRVGIFSVETVFEEALLACFSGSLFPMFNDEHNHLSNHHCLGYLDVIIDLWNFCLILGWICISLLWTGKLSSRVVLLLTCSILSTP